MDGQTSNTILPGESRVLPLTAEGLSAHLESLLLSPSFQPGDKLLPERRLAEQYGVGRPLIREVLRRLQERGMITVIPGRGTYVRQAKLTESGASVDLVAKRGQVTPRQLIAARSMLEAEAASLASIHRSEADIMRMEHLLDSLESLASANDRIDADVAFHEAVAIASANPVIQIMFGSIRNLVRGIVIRSLSDADVRGEGIPTHRVVLEAIRDQEPVVAREAMMAHLEVAQRLYGEDLDRPLRDILASRSSISFAD